MSSDLSSIYSQFNIEVAKATGHSIYVFDGFRLDGDRMLLYRGDLPTTLPPKAVETLAVLVRNRGEIVGKDELIEAVWKGSVVEESNLTQYLYLIRKTLGTRGDGTPYIETLRKRGYRFDSDTFLIKTVGINKEPTALPAPSSREFRAESRGNVLSLFDRKRQSDVREVEPTFTPKASPRSRSQFGAIAVGMLGVFVLAAVSAALFLSRPGSAVRDEAGPEQNVLRLTNGNEVLSATISPDGQYFVYLESGPEFRMWLQQTGYSSRVEIIPASKNPICCTAFSPDAEFVYYLATDSTSDTRSLYRVPKLGGRTARILTNINSAVSFSPGGEMVYSRFDKKKNETQYVITTNDGMGGERVIYTASGSYYSPPAWSPDGKTIAFAMSLSGEAGDFALSVIDVADGSVKSVGAESWDTCHRVLWRPDGRGLYFIGTKKGERLTAGRDQLYFVSYPDGRSRRITTDPTTRQQADSLGVTNDGSVLSVPYNRSSQIWVMDADGDARSAFQLTSGTSDGRAGLAPLADGRLAYVGRSGDNTNIFVMNQEGSDQIALLADGVIPDEPRSSRGSSYLVFSIYDWPYSHLFRANADGSDATQLTFGKSREIDSSVSNDGKWVAYGRLAVPIREADISLWKISINGGDPIRLKQNNCLMPHFSPDDTMLSCVEDQKTIHILSAVDGTLIKSIPAHPLAWLNSGARWTPDGKSVSYIVTEKGVSNIWLHPIDGKEPKRLTNFNIASIYNFAYSIDGKRLFVARGTQIRDAVLIATGR